jgi:hypothetical protein
MVFSHPKLGPNDLDETDIETYLALARVHGEERSPGERIATLEDIVRAAWRLMSEEQKEAFRTEAEIASLTDSFGDYADDQNANF